MLDDGRHSSARLRHMARTNQLSMTGSRHRHNTLARGTVFREFIASGRSRHDHNDSPLLRHRYASIYF